MSQKLDIVIIGAGNAGFGVSQIAEANGNSIAFFPFMGRAGQLDPREYQPPENPADLSIESISLHAQGRDDISHWNQDAGALSQG